MNYYEAMILLDKVKDGENIQNHLIAKALELTGDLSESEFNKRFGSIKGVNNEFSNDNR